MIFDTPISGLLDLWGALVEAYHGVHGYGGDTAEVYAYTLQPRSPQAELAPAGSDLYRTAIAGREVIAQGALDAILHRFQERYPCRVHVDGGPGHRWHIRVERTP